MAYSQTVSKSDHWDLKVEVDEADLFEVLQNARCRRLLGTIGDQPLTVNEIAAKVDIPVSTLYRQLGELVDVGLVEKSIRLDPSGQHATQYATCVSDISISVRDGFAVTVA